MRRQHRCSPPASARRRAEATTTRTTAPATPPAPPARPFADELAADGSIPPEGATCIVNALDDATFQRIWVLGFTDGDDAVGNDAQVTAAITQAATTCAAA